MKSATNSKTSNNTVAAFTLAEVLAALMFMALVIPVAVQALRIASLAGEVGQRKNEAVRVAERLLNENIALTNWNQANMSGTVSEGTRQFRWTLHSEIWDQAGTNVLRAASSGAGQLAASQPPVNQFLASQLALNLLTVEVKYAVQDQDYSVRLSTLVNSQ